MQRRRFLLLLLAGVAIMSLVKLYERRERARFMASHPVMLPMERRRLERQAWPELNGGVFTVPPTFETRFTVVSRGAYASLQDLDMA